MIDLISGSHVYPYFNVQPLSEQCAIERAVSSCNGNPVNYMASALGINTEALECIIGLYKSGVSKYE